MLGFIGTGNMAQAIIRGCLSSGFAGDKTVAAYDKDTEKLSDFSSESGILACCSCKELLEMCDTVVLAVKPDVLSGLLTEHKASLEKKLIISIAAGKSLGFYSNILGDRAKVIRVMPNINAVVGEAISAYCSNENVSAEEESYAGELLCSFGRAIKLPEEKFSVYSAIGGCSPAFVYMFIDSMARAAVKYGMNKSEALKVSAQSVLGSAKMLLESGVHPWELVDRVCSPGGTTIEGVTSLEADGFAAAVERAVEASFLKDKTL